MSHHDSGDISSTIREAIEKALPGSQANVAGGGGHYTIEVAGPQFAGVSRIDGQRLVYSAISHLMSGNDAPLHAVDKLVTKAAT